MFIRQIVMLSVISVCHLDDNEHYKANNCSLLLTADWD